MASHSAQTVDKPTHRKNAEKSKPAQTKNPINKRISHSRKKRLCESIFAYCVNRPLNVPLYACRGGFLVCVCFSTSAACRKILFRHAEATASAVAFFHTHLPKTTSFFQSHYHLHPFAIDFLRKTCYNIINYKQLHRVSML